MFTECKTLNTKVLLSNNKCNSVFTQLTKLQYIFVKKKYHFYVENINK